MQTKWMTKRGYLVLDLKTDTATYLAASPFLIKFHPDGSTFFGFERNATASERLERYALILLIQRSSSSHHFIPTTAPRSFPISTTTPSLAANSKPSHPSSPELSLKSLQRGPTYLPAAQSQLLTSSPWQAWNESRS